MPSLKNLNINLLAVIACLLWSTAFAGIKIGLAYTTPLNFAGVRFFIAGAMLLPFAGRPRALLSAVRKHIGYLFAVSILSTVLVYSLFYLGISLASASTTAIVVGAGPLFVTILAHFLMPNDPITLKKGVALAGGLFGIWTIAAGKYGETSSDMVEFSAIFLLIGANISGGYANILVAKNKRDIPPLSLSAIQLVIGGALLFVISLTVEGTTFKIKPLPYYGALVYLSSISAGAMTLWFTILSRPNVRVSEVNIWKFIIPVLGAFISWLFLENDTPDASQITGMFVIAGALVLMNFKLKKT